MSYLLRSTKVSGERQRRFLTQSHAFHLSADGQLEVEILHKTIGILIEICYWNHLNINKILRGSIPSDKLRKIHFILHDHTHGLLRVISDYELH